jgi:hypothetical protein
VLQHPTRRFALVLACLAVPGLAAVSCGAAQAGLHVVVSGNLIAGQDYDQLSVEVARASDAKSLAVETAQGSELRLPMSFNFVSGPTTPAGTELTVTARALHAGAMVSTASGKATLALKEGALLELTLPPVAQLLDAGDDAGFDGGDVDAGPVDAGPVDAGPVDAGPVDAGPVDAGQDGGNDAGPLDAGPRDGGPDAGPDAGVDGGADAGPPWGLGVSCALNGDCLSGRCVDGRCCNSTCGAACDACNVPGSLGICAPSPLSSAGVPSCAPYVCDGTSVTCPTACTADTQCDATHYCRTANPRICTLKKANGLTCTGSAQCLQGNCIDSYCCNSACVGACNACNLTGALGVCTLQASTYSATCSPYRCTGTTETCKSTCTVDADCAPGNYCAGTACVAKKAPGAGCLGANECAAPANCVDGVCCSSACAGPCDVCNKVGSVGTCTLSSSTDLGTPSCAPYTCSGTSNLCGTTCAGGGCASGVPCSTTGVCMLKLDTLQDNFNAAGLNAAKWVTLQTGDATVAVVGASLRLAASIDGGYASVTSVLPYDGTSSWAKVELPSAGDQGLASLTVVFAVKRGPGDRVAFTVQNGIVSAEQMLDGGTAALNSLAYVPAGMRFLRIRELGGTTYFEYSADGVSYSMMTSAPNPIPMGEVYPELGAGSGLESNAWVVTFDNFNL